MQEWWTYSLSDFLLFSARTYYRLIERHNVSVWPVHILTLGLGLLILWLVWRPKGSRSHAIPALLGILWAWVGWAFLWQRYATINWAAVYLAWLFAAEVVLLLWIGVARGSMAFALRRDAPCIAGLVLLVLALPVYPLIAPLAGRGWRQAEVFGVMPDPTVIATLGVLLLVQGRVRWELLAVPILWCLISGATLWAMGAPEAWVPFLAAVLALFGWVRRRNLRPGSSAA